MKFLIIGAGGIGAYFGARLIKSGHDVSFAARGEQLLALQKNKLKLKHPEFNFHEKVKAFSIEEIKKFDTTYFDAILLSTKSTSTLFISKDLQNWFGNKKKIPYIISLQNGVENEEILALSLNKKYIVAGLTRKIGAHIVKPGLISSTGSAETILGSLEETSENEIFLNNLSQVFNEAKIPTFISSNIQMELWKKLIINNGVNGICALLREETGVIMHNNKLSKIVYGLMRETAQAALNKAIIITKEEVDAMFELITNFDSIKPSMLIDVENNKDIELEEICNVVIRNCEAQNLDAPYTRTISTLLEYNYSKIR